MRLRSCSRAAIAFAAALGLACGTLSIPEERELGAQVDSQVRRELPLVNDAAVTDYVRGIGARIVDASGPQPFDYRFSVVDSEEINAFALPAGYVYVHTKTILAARNVSELAGVIGHEVGHVVERHVAQNYKRQRNVGVLHTLGVLTAAVLGGGLAAEAVNVGGGAAATAYLSRYGRDAEREADAFAVRVLPRAGYDPHGLVTFFETLMEEGGGGAPAALQFLSSHPATDERIANARAMIAEEHLPPGLQVTDGGRLELIQRRIRLLQGRYEKR